MNKKTVLFISHDASRTGAPIILLDLLKWVSANCDIKFKLLLGSVEGARGELLGEFENINELMFFYTNSPGKPNGIIKSAINHYISELVTNRLNYVKLKNKLKNQNIGLIYSNTITNGKILDFLSFLKCPVITHVHELDFWIKHRAGQENLKFVKKYTTRYIAVSQAVKDNLIQNHDIPEKNIDTAYGFIPTPTYNKEIILKFRKTFFKKLNIPHNAFIVGACGTTDWRKGPDLFIQLALTLLEQKPDTPVHFIWVGGENNGPQFNSLWHDVKKSGLEDHVHFVGVCKNPLDYFSTFDVFALVSREDPFPLAMLEAASLGKPIICFDHAGGAREFVENDSGFVVPYLDIGNMAKQVLNLVKDKMLLNKLGNQAARKVKERYTTERGARNILEIINRFI